MRRDDILLRDAARRGEPGACLEMANRLFAGKNGFARNFKLGLAYIQQELDRGSGMAILLVADMVPLEVLMAQQTKAVLVAATRLGSSCAMLKLGVWQALCGKQRREGAHWINRSAKLSREYAPQSLDDPREFALLLKSHFAPDVLDAGEVFLTGTREALKERDARDVGYCIRAAAQLMEPEGRLAESVSAAVRLAAHTIIPLGLPAELVETCLASRCEQGEVEAQYGLGCAFAGIPYGHLLPQELATRSNLRRAAALLLRAADAGKPEAWLNLYEIASDYRSAAGNQEAARFFLEKAAKCGVVVAQRKLGALLLGEANSLERAEGGVHWLNAAAEGGDGAARELLETLVLPLPTLPAGMETSIVEKVRAVDAELAARLALARAFHLTRREALNFNARRDIRPWGVLIPGTAKENPKGRLAPAIHEPMKAELQRAASFFNGASSFDSIFALHKGRAQREMFKALSISEDMFFPAEIGRSWSHYGFGRHWAAKAAPLLKEMLQ
jgi:TPR repeat protein